jgi:hypothetical protein
MVPADHTIHVHFTNFSFYGNDKKDVLQFYENISGTFQLRSTLHGSKPLFALLSTSDLLFKFSSNEANNSVGFRAEYNIFMPTGELI